MKIFSNPARSTVKKSQELYPYYAGFDAQFAREAVEWATGSFSNARVLDPWSGSGTTTRAAASLGLESIGLDLNPVMVLVAKAEILDAAEAPVLLPLAKRIVKLAAKQKGASTNANPLRALLSEGASRIVTSYAESVWLHVVDSRLPSQTTIDWNLVAPLAGCYFVALFNALRVSLASLATSNPTWLKAPKIDTEKINFDSFQFAESFQKEVSRIAKLIRERDSQFIKPIRASLELGDSRSLQFLESSVTSVVTSPPYCTRIDYGRSTLPELLILESLGVASYEDSRVELMGAAVNRRELKPSSQEQLGETACQLLDRIKFHPSKGSAQYYYRSHLNYFSDLSRSIGEISRVVVANGRVCMVVQDSFYKEIHNDLPKITSEIARTHGLAEVGRFAYYKKRSMCSINPSSQKYKGRRVPTEAALLFVKE